MILKPLPSGQTSWLSSKNSRVTTNMKQPRFISKLFWMLFTLLKNSGFILKIKQIGLILTKFYLKVDFRDRRRLPEGLHTGSLWQIREATRPDITTVTAQDGWHLWMRFTSRTPQSTFLVLTFQRLFMWDSSVILILTLMMSSFYVVKSHTKYFVYSLYHNHHINNDR